MQPFRLQTVIQQDGTLTLSNLPLKAGSTIEIIIFVQPMAPSPQNPYPLRGKPITYINPLEPVAQTDWSVIR